MRSEVGDVAVVIPCFEHKHVLGAAIASAVSQSVRAREIVVVDDGSTEDLSGVISQFPQARLIRQENRGLAGARNTGLRATTAAKIIFLDADDTLRAGAVGAGLKCFGSNPDAGFVYGGFQEVRGRAVKRSFCRVSDRNELVKCNWIGMIATVMFDRCKLLEIDGFDEKLGMAEDWDAYLRLSRRYPFAAHPNIVARYVKHETNMSNDTRKLEEWVAVVRAREWERGLDAIGQRAWLEGEQLCRVAPGFDAEPPTGLTRRVLRKGARLLGLAR